MGAILFQITTLTHLIVFIFMLFSFSPWFAGYMKECISGIMFLSKHLFYVYGYSACMNAHVQTFWRFCPGHQLPNPTTSLLYTNFMPLALSWVWPKASFLNKLGFKETNGLHLTHFWSVAVSKDRARVSMRLHSLHHEASLALFRRFLSITASLLCISALFPWLPLLCEERAGNW